MDFTYVRTWTGFSYVAFVVDVFAQRIVAWNAASAKDTDLSWRRCAWRSGSATATATPSCPASSSDTPTPARRPYTSINFTEHLDLEGIRPSIGSVGDACDTALMESVIGLYKTECIRTTVFHAGPYRTIADVEYATAGWVDWYNNRGLHGSLDYLTPLEFEQAHYATLNREPQPVLERQRTWGASESSEYPSSGGRSRDHRGAGWRSRCRGSPPYFGWRCTASSG